MAQVVATRSIHGSFLSQGSGSVQERVEKLKPVSFASKMLARGEKKSKRIVLSWNSRITAKRAAPEAVPVSPEDVPKVCATWNLSDCPLSLCVWLLTKHAKRKI